MKNFFYFLVLLIGFVSCKPEPPQEIGQQYSTAEGISGVWTISDVLITDEAFPVKLKRSIGDYFQTEAPVFQITFNEDDRSYIVENTGNARHFFGAGGMYGFDDETYPTQLLLFTSGDTITMKFNKATREIDPMMNISHVRKACEKAYINYNYVLLRTDK